MGAEHRRMARRCDHCGDVVDGLSGMAGHLTSDHPELRRDPPAWHSSLAPGADS